MEIAKKKWAPDACELAIFLDSVAAQYIEESRDGDAELLLKKSLEILERALGANHPEVGYSISLLGWLLISKGVTLRRSHC